MLVDKESGPSSFGVVERIKRLIGARKVGHAGTLDPFATGLLVVLINQGTKLSPFLMSQDKVYRAALRLGIETDTDDVTGTVTQQREVGPVGERAVEEALEGFVGTIKQVPPRYSAVHHKGKRAYELARKGVEFVPREREVRIDYITIRRIDLPVVWIEVGCSSGTYIRSLASGLGRRLGTGAHLASLRRMRSGLFHVDMSYTVQQIAGHLGNRALESVIIPLKDAVEDMWEVEVSSTLASRIRDGYIPQRGELSGEHGSMHGPGCYCKAVNGQELVAILRESNTGYEVQRIFT
ncbi:MAG: tRNA pseudouridine(55) synthase TruB [Deltaproteobacteria bacterium]|nr:tRNA pseudouridine(55) synthase TruB [Deltaproteobacteria bacterium]